MRLPSHLLAKLALTAAAAGCETTAERGTCEPGVTTDDTPLREIVRAPHDDVAVAPRLVPPPPPPPTHVQPTPQPVVKKRPKRKVLASVCGHVELVEDTASLVRCGRG